MSVINKLRKGKEVVRRPTFSIFLLSGRRMCAVMRRPMWSMERGLVVLSGRLNLTQGRVQSEIVQKTLRLKLLLKEPDHASFRHLRHLGDALTVVGDDEHLEFNGTADVIDLIDHLADLLALVWASEILRLLLQFFEQGVFRPNLSSHLNLVARTTCFV